MAVNQEEWLEPVPAKERVRCVRSRCWHALGAHDDDGRCLAADCNCRKAIPPKNIEAAVEKLLRAAPSVASTLKIDPNCLTCHGEGYVKGNPTRLTCSTCSARSRRSP